MARGEIVLAIHEWVSPHSQGKESVMFIVGIDWNNTIEDQIGQLILESNGRLTRQDFAIWDDPSGCEKMEMSPNEFIAWCWKRDGPQEMALPFPGVKDAIGKMVAKGWKIKIITATNLSISKIIAWFDRHNIPFDEIVKAKDKSQVGFDVLIDDNPVTLQEIDRPLVKFALPWNDDINIHSFSDWRLV